MCKLLKVFRCKTCSRGIIAYLLTCVCVTLIAPGPTQASPEKARCDDYSFPADVWAYACTFLHAVSGYMPWTQRFPENNEFVYIVSTCATYP